MKPPFTRVLWLSLSTNNDPAKQNQPPFPKKGRLSQGKAMVLTMNNRFTQNAQNVLRRARKSAEKFGHTYIGSEHLLLGILQERDSSAFRFLSSKGFSEEVVRSEIVRLDGTGTPNGSSMQSMTPKLKGILERAAKESERLGNPRIHTDHLLWGLLGEENGVAARILGNKGFSVTALFHEFSAEMHRADPFTKEKEPPPTALSAYSQDLTARAAEGKLEPVIGRDAETDRLIRILCRKQKNNPCLVGEPGVGKTAVVEGLALRICRRAVPELLLDRTILSLDLSAMIAGAKYRGEFEDRLRKVMKEVNERSDRILFIDEIHTIVGAGAAEGSLDAANILKPLLSRGGISVIGATTPDEYRKFIEKDRALERRFQPISIEEPSEEATMEILRGLRPGYEKHHGVLLSDEALSCAVSLSKRYLWDRKLPDKAIDLLDETAAEMRVRAQTPPSYLAEMEKACRALEESKEEAIRAQDFERAAALRDVAKESSISYVNARQKWKSDQEALQTVTAADIAETLSEMTGIPLGELEQDELSGLAALREKLENRVVGQSAAADALASAVLRVRLGLHPDNRPMGSFLFAGPTGVGKTEMARGLTEYLFGNEEALFRLDMSEYMEKHSVSKLIGSPPGYVGYEEGGILTEYVRRHPYSVILFDEIEKAHRDICGILLQITEEGRLMDSQGRKADFRNTIILLTTNLGGEEKARPGFLGRTEAEAKQEREEALQRFFPPELLGRMDEIVHFSPLSQEAYRKIAARLLGEISEGAAKKNIRISFDAGVTEALLKNLSPKEGARHLRSAVRRTVEDRLALAVVTGEVARGTPYLAIWEDGTLHFQKELPALPCADK